MEELRIDNIDTFLDQSGGAEDVTEPITPEEFTFDLDQSGGAEDVTEPITPEEFTFDLDQSGGAEVVTEPITPEEFTFDLDQSGGAEDVTEPITPEEFTFDLDQSGGADSEDNKEYKETLKYIENYKGMHYQNYLKNFENYFKEQSNKSNLSKFKYIAENNKLVKKNVNTNKESFNLALPDYKNVKDILKQIDYKLDDTGFHLKKIRNELLRNSSNSTNVKEFQKLQAEFLKLTHLQQIFSNYDYKINNKDVINERLNSLFEERNTKKLKLHSIMLKIEEINKTTKNYLEIKKLAEEYLQINNINEIDKTIQELIHTPSIDHIVMSLPVPNKTTEQTKPEKIKIKPVKKKKLKIKEESVKPSIEPKKTDIETTIFDKDGKKRRQIKGKKVEEAVCMFPFKEKNKYINKEDGCVESKSGQWCATSVNEDYSYDKMGFCKNK